MQMMVVMFMGTRVPKVVTHDTASLDTLLETSACRGQLQGDNDDCLLEADLCMPMGSQ